MQPYVPVGKTRTFSGATKLNAGEVKGEWVCPRASPDVEKQGGAIVQPPFIKITPWCYAITELK